MRTAVAKDKAKDKNIVHCRLKRMGERFEISMNRDKMPSKKDIASKDFQPNWTELLVAQLVFSNAAKNEVADKNSVAKAFADMKDAEIFQMILEKGEILASLEDRNESMAEDKNFLAKLAAQVAGTSHVRPSADDIAADKKKRPRLTRYLAADIERELKNIKFKPDPAASLKDQAIDAIHAIVKADNIPLMRDSRVVVFEVERAALEETKRAIAAAFRTCDHKVLSSTTDSVTVLLDYAVDAQTVANGHDVLRKAVAVHTTEEFYIPKTPSGADDLSTLLVSATASDAAAASKGGKSKGEGNVAAQPKGKGGKQNKGTEGAAPVASSNLTALEAELKALQDDDSDDGGRKGRGGKGKGKASKPQPKAPAPKAAAPATNKGGAKGRRDFESDEDENDDA